MKIAGVVLAGGLSSRMGTNKSELIIDSKTLLQHAKDILKSTSIQDIFTSGEHGIKDTLNHKGPVSGIHSCLEYLDDYEFVMFIPVDMPLLNKYVLLKLISEKNLHAVYFEKKQFPMLVKNNLINRKIIQQQLNNDNLTVYNMLQKLEAKSIKSYFPIEVFTNTNTQEDWLSFTQQLVE